MTASLILSSLGGIVSFMTGIYFVVRSVLKNVNATRDNTKALQEVKKTLIRMGDTIDDHTVKIAILNDRVAR